MSENETEALDRELDRIKRKYSRIKKSSSHEIHEELETCQQIEIVNALIEHLDIDCDLGVWIDMNNSLAMTGTLYSRAEADMKPVEDKILRLFIDGKIDEERAIEQLRYEAMEAGIEDIDAIIERFEDSLANIKDELDF